MFESGNLGLKWTIAIFPILIFSNMKLDDGIFLYSAHTDEKRQRALFSFAQRQRLRRTLSRPSYFMHQVAVLIKIWAYICSQSDNCTKNSFLSKSKKKSFLWIPCEKKPKSQYFNMVIIIGHDGNTFSSQKFNFFHGRTPFLMIWIAEDIFAIKQKRKYNSLSIRKCIEFGQRAFDSSTIMPILIMQSIQTYSKLLSYPLSPSSDQPYRYRSFSTYIK